MPTFKKFTGNYIQIADTLGISEDSYKINDSRDEYNDHVKIDIDRQVYFNPYGDVKVLKDRLMDIQHLADNELSYNQGNFYASVFSESFIKKDPAVYGARILRAADEETHETFSDHIGFSYLDDDNNLCGCSIVYMRDDSNTTITADSRPRPFVIAFIKHVNNAPKAREVTFISHTSFLEKVRGGEAIETSGLSNEIAKALNCTPIQPLLLSVIKGSNVDLPKFKDLKKRLVADTNLDDKDPKLERLCDLLIVWARLLIKEEKSPEQNTLMERIVEVISQAYDDINFFKEKSLEDINELVKCYEDNPFIASLPQIEEAEKTKVLLMEIIQNQYIQARNVRSLLNKQLEKYTDQSNQSFFRRNLGNLVLMTVAALAVTAIFLILSGIFAPLGLTIATGLATGFAIGGAGLASLIAVERGYQITKNENQLENELERVTRELGQEFDIKQQVKSQLSGDSFKRLLSYNINPTQAPVVSQKQVEKQGLTSTSNLSVGKLAATMFGNTGDEQKRGSEPKLKSDPSGVSINP